MQGGKLRGVKCSAEARQKRGPLPYSQAASSAKSVHSERSP